MENRDQLLFTALVEALEKMGISVRFEDLDLEEIRGKGGKCRVREKEMIIIERSLSLDEKVDILAGELARLPSDDIYLPPNVRDAIEKVGGDNFE